MKKYEELEMEIVKALSKDIITTSGDDIPASNQKDKDDPWNDLGLLV